MTGVGEPELAFLDAGDLDEIRPLWLELLGHHLRTSPPQLPPGVGEEQSWRRRRAAYEEWLAHPKAFGLVARADGAPVAYAMVSVHGAEVLDDTWDGGPEVAELQTLVVSGAMRSAGLGGRMLGHVEHELRARRIAEMIVAAVASNDRAVSFYLQHHYVPYLTYLYRRLDGPPS